MGLASLLFSNPALFFILAVLLLYSVIAHEVAHGWVAHLFGDNTAKNSGRLTLNPVSHIDPLGAIMLLLVGFGWAKPVPVDFYRLKNYRVGLIAVSLAGCLANILIATIGIFFLQFPAINTNPMLKVIFTILVRVNIILGAFNLIPIPPLDGSKILMAFLSVSGQQIMARLERYGFFIIIILLYTGLLNPVITFMQNLIYTVIYLLFRLFGQKPY
ncbi:MAG: site-2 protease family protein [Candidatus Omnitrophica bacterium]|jgi:Zn-dependent protease|nr:site-2 protease family protein [Candidatus Omnitrophota bacterium]